MKDKTQQIKEIEQWFNEASFNLDEEGTHYFASLLSIVKQQQELLKGMRLAYDICKDPKLKAAELDKGE